MKNRNKIVQCISNAEYVRADTYHPQNKSSCLIICRFDNFIVEAVSGYSDGEFDWVRNLPKDHDGKVLLWAYVPFPADDELRKILAEMGEHPMTAH